MAGEDLSGGPEASILLVDDVPANLLALEACLASPSYRIVKANSGREALGCVLKQDFAVILLDVFMPEMDGIEVANLLKKREKSRHTPIVFVTAADRDEQRMQAGYAVGAIDYLHKPLDAQVVRAKVAGLVELWRRTQEIKQEAARLRAAEQHAFDERLARLDEERERRYRTLAEAVPPMVWTSRPDGAIDYCNQRWFDFTGLSFEHAQGWGWLAALHPSDVPAVRSAWKRATQDSRSFETECRVRNATTGVYRWQLARALPETGADGRIAAWIGSFTDIDDLRQAQASERIARAEAEKALAAAEAARIRATFLGEASATLASSLDYRTTLNRVAHLAVPQMADWCVVDVVVDQDTVHQMAAAHVDPAKEDLARTLQDRHLGWPASAHGLGRVLRARSSEIYPEPEDSQWFAQTLGSEHPDALRALGARSYMIVPLVARERVLGAITFVYAESGRRYGADDLAFAEDLARRAATAIDNARLFAEARNAVAVRDQFLSIASHELKTPLTSLSLLLQSQLRRANGRGDDLREPLERANRQSGRLAHLVDELLDFSRVAAHRLRIEREKLDLGELVRDVAENLLPSFEDSGSTIHLDDVQSVTGAWDRLRLEQVTANLLVNAVKYGRGRPVHVSVEADGEAAVLRIRDEGIGISAADRERIFAAFERAVTERSFAGVGLGLYITRELVRIHGGEIRVESEPGRGSTFLVRLPREAPAGAEEAVVCGELREVPCLGDAERRPAATSGVGGTDAERLGG